MFGSDNFQIKHGEVSLVGELTATGEQAIGIAMDRNAEDPDLAAPSNNGRYVGFISKKVTVEGSKLDRMFIYGYQDHPAKSGDKVTLQRVPDGGEIEVEAPPSKTSSAVDANSQPYLLVTSGTGALSTSTAKDQDLSFLNGRWRAAQSGDYIAGRVVKQLTPLVEGNVRLLIQIVSGTVKA